MLALRTHFILIKPVLTKVLRVPEQAQMTFSDDGQQVFTLY